MRFLITGLFPPGVVAGGVLGGLLGIRAARLIAFGILALAPMPVHRALPNVRDVEQTPFCVAVG
jgi:hypothetical protein